MSEALPSSFRDPSGFLFRREGILLRQVNPIYRDAYDQLMASGLYRALVDAGLLVRHEEVGLELAAGPGAYKVLRPEPIPFISYPYEWCFSQLKQAALATLRIQGIALKHGLSLKDASAFNIQFVGSRPVLIDTLSFEPYREGEPWVAYRQFCQHFVAPLALMAMVDVRLGQSWRVHLDGMPLDLAARLLPWRTRLKPGLALHIHAHAAAQRRLAGRATGGAARQGQMSRTAFLGLLDSLKGLVRSLRWDPRGTAWADYPETCAHYTAAGQADKRRIVGKWIEAMRPPTVWDLGANTGEYSRLARRSADLVLAFDGDPGAVERHFAEVVRGQETGILPLLVDLANPSPGLGWAGEERTPLRGRGQPDLVLALALLHHLAIANNLPLPLLAESLSRMAPRLIIEFVPKDDPQVQLMLSARRDIFDQYTQEGFEASFSRRYEIGDTAAVRDSSRRLYLLNRRD